LVNYNDFFIGGVTIRNHKRTPNMRFISFILLGLIIFSSSCKKEKVDTDCGCDGSTYLAIENEEARYAGNGHFVINTPVRNGGLVYGTSCKVDSTWEVSVDEKIWNYTLSGNLKRRCESIFDGRNLSMAPGGPMQITSIKKNE
jgi:hypothetical protein